MKIRINKVVINYELSGAGKSLTLVHGVGDNLNVWYNQVPVFSKHYKVLAYDVRGHGASDLPEQEISTKILAEDLYALLKELDIRETFLLGHSMGGRIAISFTNKYPEMVKALILCNCVGPGPDEKTIQKIIEAAQSEGIKGVIEEKINTTFPPDFIVKNPGVIEQYRLILQQTNVQGYLRFIQPLKQLKQHTTGNPNSPLSNINCPTMIMVGEYDPISSPSVGREVQRAINGAQLKIFPTGHSPALEKPEEFNKAILSFLSQVA